MSNVTHPRALCLRIAELVRSTDAEGLEILLRELEDTREPELIDLLDAVIEVTSELRLLAHI